MKIYIVQPMNGLSKELVAAERERGIAIARLYYPDAEILDTIFDDYDSMSPLQNLARSMLLMAQADMCLFLPLCVGHGYYGCEVEDHIAQVYGVPRFIVSLPNAGLPIYEQQAVAQSLGGDDNGT